MSMPFIAPTSGGCNSQCTDAVVTQVPGPAGADGSNGSNGADGINAFTKLSAGFTVPASGSTGLASVQSSAWMTVGQIVVMQGAGIGSSPTTQAGLFVVDSIISTTQVYLLNPAEYAAYNAAPSTVIPNASTISPGGQRGAKGASGADINSISPTTTKGDMMVDDGTMSPSASLQRFGTGATTGLILVTDNSQALGMKWAKVDLTTQVTNALPIANGGTGQITQQAALDALIAGGVTGDILYYNGTHWTKISKTTAYQLLRINDTGTSIEYGKVVPEAIKYGDNVLAISGVVNLDCSTQSMFNITSTGNLTLGMLNAVEGEEIILLIQMNGSDSLALSGTIFWEVGAPFTPTGGGAYDMVRLVYSKNYWWGSFKLNYSLNYS